MPASSSVGGRRYQANRAELMSYCREIFDFWAHLDSKEKEYLDYCFGVVPDDLEEGKPISAKTFGHRVYGDEVDSSKLGYGFIEARAQDKLAVQTLLHHRLGDKARLHAEALENCLGTGIAWYCSQDEFRIYWLFADYPRGVRLADPDGIAALERFADREVILAHSYRGNTLFESKAYYYPDPSQWPDLVDTHAVDPKRCHALVPHSNRLALVTSTLGATRFQFDPTPDSRELAVHALESPTALQLVRRCRELPYWLTLDTIAIDHDGIGLYFD